MIKSGLVDETRRLLGMGYTEELKPMKSLGYRHIIEFLKGKYSMNETVRHIQRDTRRYAKRQLTWFRTDPEMIWTEPTQRTCIEKKIKEFYVN